MKLFLSTLLFALCAHAAGPMKALIIDGQNNHKWQETTPVLKKLLEDTGLFTVEVATSPAKGEDMSAFHPDFTGYAVIVSNYNGEPWSAETKAAFEKYMAGGGGFVSYHAADNAFPEWAAYNQMIGIGGWGERTETAGPFWYFKEGKWTPDETAGKAGNHGARKPFQVTLRNNKSPITKGLPPVWMHEADELYSKLRGPGETLTVLATAFSPLDNRGTGHDEAMLMTQTFGKGRIFHTTLGHDVDAMRCAGFIATFQRGTEWAATGKVTQKVPVDFPGPDQVVLRK